MEATSNNSSEPIKLFCRGCGQKLDVSSLEPFSKIACPICQTPIRVPLPFDRYLLEKICGIGGMSKVYRAIDTEKQCRVAIKIVEPEFVNSYTNGIPFEYETNLVKRINHPGIIPIYDFGTFNEQPFLVMKYMSKGSLEYFLNKNYLPQIPILMNWLHTIALGLQAAYNHNVIHHDIKPGNILIDEDGSAGLGDFDLAELRQYGDGQSVEDWATPGYASPERLINGEEDWRGDVYSFGITVYELVTGTLPFGSNGETAALYERRRDLIPIDPAELNPKLSKRCSDLLLKMMAFRAEDRPSYDEIVKIFAIEANLAKDSLTNRFKNWFYRLKEEK